MVQSHAPRSGSEHSTNRAARKSQPHARALTIRMQHRARNARCRGSSQKSATDRSTLCAPRELLLFDNTFRRQQLLIRSDVTLGHARARKLECSLACTLRHLVSTFRIINELEQFAPYCLAIMRI